MNKEERDREKELKRLIYIKTEIFSRKLGSKIAQAQRVREDSDYDDKYQISQEKTKQQINTAEEVIENVEFYINKMYTY